MTPEQLKATRARFDSGLTLEYEQVEELLTEVERLTEIVESTDSDEMLAIQRLTALVEKMNAERATIFQRGAEAMRQVAVLASRENIGCRHVTCHSCESPAAVIRGLPIPEYKP